MLIDKDITCIKYYDDECTEYYECLSADYQRILPADLPKEFEILIVNSFDMFPLRLIEGSKFYSIYLLTHFEMNRENFQVLRTFNEQDMSIHFEWGTDAYSSWFQNELRKWTITNIIE